MPGGVGHSAARHPQPAELRRGQAAGRIRREGSEQSATLGDPAQSLLEDRDGEATPDQVADDQSDQGSIGGRIRPQQDTGRLRPELLVQARPQQRRRHMEDGKSAASDRDRR
jgi:hypothetical protein